MFILYDYFRSSAAFRVRLALNYKALTYEKIKIDLSLGAQVAPEYTQLNPSGLVPSLLTPEKQLLHQSLAILEYVEEIYPQPALLPNVASQAGPDKFVARAYVRSLALDIACDIHPLNNLRVLNYLKGPLQHNQAEVDIWYQHWIQHGLTALEQTIQNNPFYQGKYCYQEQFTWADICLLPQLFNARRFKCELNNYPLLLAIEAQCLKHKFVLDAYPDETT